MAKSLSITYRGAEPIRVNKFLALESVCSRREAEALIASGVITIDDTPVVDLGHKIRTGQTLNVTPKGQKALGNKQTFILNKPEGYVSAQPEEGQTPAARLLVPTNRYYSTRPPPQGTQYDMPSKARMYAPLGRLDQDSRGLLILSEDGVLAKAIIGEASPLEKEYRVKVLGEITDEKLELLRHGLELDDKPLKPAIVENPYKNLLAITLIEGRNRQIRRMCDEVELKVLDLIRVRVGPIRLRDLPEGEWRVLSKRERDAVLAGKNILAPTAQQKMRKPGAATDDDAQYDSADPSDYGRRDRPDFKRGDRPDSNRGPRPDFKRGDRPDSNRGPRPNFKRGDRADSNRGPRPDFKRGDRPDSDRGPRPDFKRGDRPDSNRGDRPSYNRGDRPDSNRGPRPDFKRGDRPDSNRGPRPDFKRGDRSDSNRGDRPSYNRGDRPDSNRGPRPDFKRGDRPDSNRGPRPDFKRGDRPSPRRNERPTSSNRNFKKTDSEDDRKD